MYYAPPQQDFSFTYFLIQSLAWLASIAVTVIIIWAVMDFLLVKAGYLNCRLQSYLATKTPGLLGNWFKTKEDKKRAYKDKDTTTPEPEIEQRPDKTTGRVFNMKQWTEQGDNLDRTNLVARSNTGGDIKQVPNATSQTASKMATDDDYADRIEIARLASEMSGLQIKTNPWIKAALSGSKLECRRKSKAPAEMDLSSMAPDSVKEVCSWICSKRFTANFGRYANAYDTKENTCTCNIQDCSSMAMAGNNNNNPKRKIEATDTNGVNITDKSSAAAMCPSICIMRHPGKNADAWPGWDGKNKIPEGMQLPKQQTCYCVVDE